ncbi:MAG: type I-B CRISPR-associated protein Cas5b [Methanobacteriaceae archaeon]
MKVIVFDVWGDYGYFRRGYTTTSTLSYPFPSRTTLAGMVSGILGYERDSYYDIFSSNLSSFALKINNPIKKIRMNLNVIDTKKGFLLSDIQKDKGTRSQIPAEFLKDVSYRVYLHLDDEIIVNDLYNLLSQHKTIYTPYLGISECIANVNLVGDGLFNLNNAKFADAENEVNISSIVPKNSAKIKIESGKKYGLVKSPSFMDSNRIVSDFGEFYFEECGKEIAITNGEYYSIGDDNIIFF